MSTVDVTTAIADATRTGVLHLPYMGLTSIPPAVFSPALQKALVRLDVGHNEITSLDARIGSLSRLEELWVNGNPLSDLPVELCSCACLRVLELSHTRLRQLPREMARLPGLMEVCVEGTPLEPDLRTAYTRGGTRGLLVHMRARDQLRALAASLSDKLCADLYHNDAARPDGAAAIAVLVKSITDAYEADTDALRAVIRNAERLFPPLLADASMSAVRARYDALAREFARKQMSADVELCLAAHYFSAALEPAVISAAVHSVMEALPTLDDARFLLAHARVLLPASVADLAPDALRRAVEAHKRALAEDRAAATKALEAALSGLYPESEPRDVALCAATVASLIPVANDVRALAADAADVFPAEFNVIRARKIVKVFRQLQADKGL